MMLTADSLEALERVNSLPPEPVARAWPALPVGRRPAGHLSTHPIPSSRAGRVRRRLEDLAAAALVGRAVRR